MTRQWGRAPTGSFSATLRSCQRGGRCACLAGAHQSENYFPAHPVGTFVSSTEALVEVLRAQEVRESLLKCGEWGSCLSTVTTTGCGFTSDHWNAMAYSE